MGVHLHIRNLPDDLHESLRQRAAIRGQSLSRCVVEILEDHCNEPTANEWLDGLSCLTPVALDFPAAFAVEEARNADEGDLLHGLDLWHPGWC
ncbi:MAG TPA: hypothetical protein VN851_01015 [Thermoanaerobaculia bacterium]|nr:hypothetical protein [Thermoanaerobaculia bacterium]